MVEKAAPTPPYVSYRTFKNTLQEIGAAGLPSRIDPSILRTMSGAAQSQLLGSLRFFGLVDEASAPTDDLKALTAEPSEEVWSTRLRPLLVRCYSARQRSALELGTPKELKESFEGPGIASIVEKACRFLVSAAQDVGLKVSPHIVKAGFSTPSRPKNGVGRAAVRKRHESPPDEPSHSRGVSADNPWRDALLAKFPAFNPEWPTEVQQSWFTGFERLTESLRNRAE